MSKLRLLLGLALAAALTLIQGTSSLAQAGYMIDLDSTTIAGGDDTGTIATEDGWTSLDSTQGNASPGVTIDGITFTLGSVDGSRVRENAGVASPNPLTGDFVFDDGAGQAVILFFGGAGSVPAGKWQVEMWVWDETSPVGDVIIGLRTNGAETIIGENFIPDPVDPAATFTFISDGASAYDVFVRENNTQDRSRLNAVRLMPAGADGVVFNPGSLPATTAASENVGTLVAVADPLAAGYTFTLIEGEGDTHNIEFEIDGDELLTSALWAGHAAGETLSIRVRAVDTSGGVFEGALAIPVVNDSDLDGLDDEWELMFFVDLTVATGDGNNDGDSLTNIEEFDRGTFPNDEDSDDDGLNDDIEDNDGEFNGADDPGTDPLLADTDGDGVDDGDELDDGTNPLVADSDGDGLDDGEEKARGTRPDLADTDGDGQGDGDEVMAGSDPLDAADPPASNFLAAYWPLDTPEGDPATTTPDAGPNGYDLVLNNMDATNFVSEEGRRAASFNGVDTILTRIHTAGEQLPINQHAAYTVAMWVKVKGTGQNDLRFFSEGSTTNNSPLFNLGTRNDSDQVNLFLRPSSQQINLTNATDVLDDSWRHFAVTSNGLNETIALYVDGVLDRDDVPYASITTPALDTTSVGGILRAAASHWITGLVDDVALWSSVLQPDDILALAEGTSPLDIGDTGPRFAITSIVMDTATNEVTLTWNSKPDREYIVRVSNDLQGDPTTWADLTDDHPSGGETTTYVDTVDPAVDPRRFYVIQEAP